jgi:hypothetical protein
VELLLVTALFVLSIVDPRRLTQIAAAHPFVSDPTR